MAYDTKKSIAAEEAFLKDPTPENRNALVMCHTGIIHLYISKYLPMIDEHDKDDVFNEGVLGLIRATESFDPAQSKFASYAGLWVKNFILNHVTRSNSYQYAAPKSHIYDRNAKSKKKEKKKLKMMKRLDEPVKASSDSEATTLHEVLSAKQNNTDGDVWAKEVENIVYTLSRNEFANSKVRQIIIKDRLLADEPRTLRSIGKDVGITSEAVRLHEMAIKKRIKERLQQNPEDSILN